MLKIQVLDPLTSTHCILDVRTLDNILCCVGATQNKYPNFFQALSNSALNIIDLLNLSSITLLLD